MSKVIDPYAPPKAALEVAPPHRYWREGKVLVIHVDSPAPPRCVKCNKPAVLPMRKIDFYWHHRLWYVLAFAMFPLYLVAYLLVRKKATVALGLCPKHQLRRAIFSVVGIAGSLLGFYIALVGANGGVWRSPIFGIVLMLLAPLIGLAGSRTAYPSRITKEEIRLRGCGTVFLDSLGDGSPARMSIGK